MSLSSVFNYNEARQWHAAVEELNAEAESVLKEVAQCIEEIGSGCEGVIVQDLVQIASGMAEKFATLVESLKNLAAALLDVLAAFLNFDDEVKNSLTEAASTLLGGILT